MGEIRKHERDDDSRCGIKISSNGNLSQILGFKHPR